ncbi:MAG: flagellar assembly protein FliW, partial [Lachnospiraceae bacterium]|nr:flagellar assembly protein FliW [Lachnospiraceae bacterium]
MNTKYFGEINIDEKEIITFKPGLFGFEDKTKFVLLSFLDENGESSEDSLMCLQSTEDPQLAFIIMNPYYIVAEYDPYKGAEKDLKEIELG